MALLAHAVVLQHEFVAPEQLVHLRVTRVDL